MIHTLQYYSFGTALEGNVVGMNPLSTRQENPIDFQT